MEFVSAVVLAVPPKLSRVKVIDPRIFTKAPTATMPNIAAQTH